MGKRSRATLASLSTASGTAICGAMFFSSFVFYTCNHTSLSGHPVLHSLNNPGKQKAFPVPAQVTAQSSQLSKRQQMVKQVDQSRGAVACANGHLLTADRQPCENFVSEMRKQLIYYVENEQTRYMVCPIPKNGCTYHLGLMYRVGGERKYERMGAVHGVATKLRYQLTSQPVSKAMELLFNESVPKYMVVRNPIHRTLSAYLDKVERYYTEEEKTAEAFQKWVFEEFNMGDNWNWSKTNPHWRPQTEFCGYKLSGIDERFRKFREEKAEEYVDFLYKMLPREVLDDGWGTENKSFRAYVLGPRARTGNTSEKITKYFNVTVVDHLSEILREDIVRLGYEHEVEALRMQLAAATN